MGVSMHYFGVIYIICMNKTYYLTPVCWLCVRRRLMAGLVVWQMQTGWSDLRAQFLRQSILPTSLRSTSKLTNIIFVKEMPPTSINCGQLDLLTTYCCWCDVVYVRDKIFCDWTKLGKMLFLCTYWITEFIALKYHNIVCVADAVKFTCLCTDVIIADLLKGKKVLYSG